VSGSPGGVRYHGFMPISSILWLVVCASALALSLASVRVLGPRSRATQSGWIATAAYAAVAGIDLLRAQSAPLHVDYALLGALAVAFVVAGFRDEPQAEPWWRPTHAGLTGAERRAKR